MKITGFKFQELHYFSVSIQLANDSHDAYLLIFFRDMWSLFFKKYILLIMLLRLSHFPPFIPLHPAYLLPPAFPHLSSSPWVIHVSSLASTFPTLFLTSPIFYLLLMLLILCTFSPLSPSHAPADNPPCDLHFCASVPVLMVLLSTFLLLFL